MTQAKIKTSRPRSRSANLGNSSTEDPSIAAMDRLKEARQACVVAYKEAEKLVKTSHFGLAAR